jgi:hypothetical protein
MSKFFARSVQVGLLLACLVGCNSVRSSGNLTALSDGPAAKRFQGKMAGKASAILADECSLTITYGLNTQVRFSYLKNGERIEKELPASKFSACQGNPEGTYVHGDYNKKVPCDSYDTSWGMFYGISYTILNSRETGIPIEFRIMDLKALNTSKALSECVSLVEVKG